MTDVARNSRQKAQKAVKVPKNLGVGTLQADVRIVSMDNPLYSKTHAGASGNPKTIDVAMNLRESPVAMMAAKGHLEAHHVQAGLKFRRLWETLGGAGAGSFDYSREFVDGGGPRDPISDSQLNAGLQLKQCQQFLGRRPYDIVCKVAGQGCFIAELYTTQRDRKTMADYLRHALDDLAEHWGYKTRPRRSA